MKKFIIIFVLLGFSISSMLVHGLLSVPEHDPDLELVSNLPDGLVFPLLRSEWVQRAKLYPKDQRMFSMSHYNALRTVHQKLTNDKEKIEYEESNGRLRNREMFRQQFLIEFLEYGLEHYIFQAIDKETKERFIQAAKTLAQDQIKWKEVFELLEESVKKQQGRITIFDYNRDEILSAGIPVVPNKRKNRENEKAESSRHKLPSLS